MSFLQDARTFAAATAEGTLAVHNATSGNRLLAVSGHDDAITSLAMSADGNTLVSADLNGTVQICNPDTGSRLSELPGISHERGRFVSAAWSPDGRCLATGESWWWPRPGAESAPLCLWSNDSLLSRRTLDREGGEHSRVVWSPDGRAVAARGPDRAVHQYGIATGERLRFPSTECIAWSPDAERIALGGTEGNRLEIRRVASREVLRTLQTDGPGVSALAWSGDGMLLASLSSASVQVWNPDSGELLKTIASKCERGAWGLAFSPDSKSLAVTTGAWGVAQVWDVSSAKCVKWRNGEGHAWALAYSPDGTNLAVSRIFGGSPSVVSIWDLRADETLHTLPLAGRVRVLSWSPDGQLLAAPDYGCRLRFWDMQSGELHAVLLRWHGEEGIVVRHDGHYCVTPGVADQLVYVGQTSDGRQLTLTPDEFERQYGWKNDPSKVTLTTPNNKHSSALSEQSASDKPKAPPAEAKP